ncbi:MAG TPA: ABC transporter ATP-binding protein [Thermodesulfobacteriota bacterium]|nr:ABC transporter ATP-binding protein [Thermodesulfobacteriota bacterium]
MKEIIRTENLEKYFGEMAAIHQVTVALEEGLFTSVIGPNGAGKTTLINLLSGYLRPDGGKVFFQGREITHLGPDQRVKIGISRSFQVMNIFPRLTVFQNILLPVLSRFEKTSSAFSSLGSQKDCVEEAEKILGEVWLQKDRNVPAGQLSHGDQRLLELGIAVASNPRLCFLDEPSSGMNPIERIKVLELVKKLASERRTTFIIVEHDMDIVFSLSDWIVVMNRGEILAQGKPGEIRENKEVRDIYLGEEI